jgi:two-component system, chemotaxis family, protein-glutamate methylesterase/glutaminase
MKRYPCHTGHSVTAATLLNSQSEQIEEMLRISLRMFEERKNLLKNVRQTVHRGPKRSDRQLLGETQGYIDRLRGMLVTAESHSPDDTFTRVKGLMAEPTKAKSTR